LMPPSRSVLHTLSLHDALPILAGRRGHSGVPKRPDLTGRRFRVSSPFLFLERSRSAYNLRACAARLTSFAPLDLRSGTLAMDRTRPLARFAARHADEDANGADVKPIELLIADSQPIALDAMLRVFDQPGFSVIAG